MALSLFHEEEMYCCPSLSITFSVIKTPWWFPGLILGDSCCTGVSCSRKDFGLLPSQPLASEEENFSFYTQSHAPFTLHGSFCLLAARGSVPGELVLGPWLWNNQGL